MDIATLIALIQSLVTTNGNREIEASDMRQVLEQMLLQAGEVGNVPPSANVGFGIANPHGTFVNITGDAYIADIEFGSIAPGGYMIIRHNAATPPAIPANCLDPYAFATDYRPSQDNYLMFHCLSGALSGVVWAEVMNRTLSGGVTYGADLVTKYTKLLESDSVYFTGAAGALKAHWSQRVVNVNTSTAITAAMNGRIIKAQPIADTFTLTFPDYADLPDRFLITIEFMAGVDTHPIRIVFDDESPLETGASGVDETITEAAGTAYFDVATPGKRYTFLVDKTEGIIWVAYKYLPPGAGGVTDHGDLTGLADDDHPQYHNDARGDLRYSLLSHNHALIRDADGDTSVNVESASDNDEVRITSAGQLLGRFQATGKIDIGRSDDALLEVYNQGDASSGFLASLDGKQMLSVNSADVRVGDADGVGNGVYILVDDTGNNVRIHSPNIRLIDYESTRDDGPTAIALYPDVNGNLRVGAVTGAGGANAYHHAALPNVAALQALNTASATDYPSGGELTVLDVGEYWLKRGDATVESLPNVVVDAAGNRWFQRTGLTVDTSPLEIADIDGLAAALATKADAAATTAALATKADGAATTAALATKADAAATTAALATKADAAATTASLAGKIAKTEKAVQTLADGATITLALAGEAGRNAKVTIAGARTLEITGAEAGDMVRILVTQGAGGGHSIATFPAGTTFEGSAAPTWSPNVGDLDRVDLFYDGTGWTCTVRNYGAPTPAFDPNAHSALWWIDPADTTGWTIGGGEVTAIVETSTAARSIPVTGGLPIAGGIITGDGTAQIEIGAATPVVAAQTGVACFVFVVDPATIGSGDAGKIVWWASGDSYIRLDAAGVTIGQFYSDSGTLALSPAPVVGVKQAFIVQRNASDLFEAHFWNGSVWQASSTTHSYTPDITFNSGDTLALLAGDDMFLHGAFSKYFSGADLDALKAYLETR